MCNSKTIWLTGLSGSGKTTLANALLVKFKLANIQSFILDGDIVRQGLNKDLGFTEKDRAENLRRIAEVAKILNNANIIVIAAFISPLEKDRQTVKSIIGGSHFFEVYVNTPLAVCEERDPKGLYKKARAGEIPHFTGVSSRYEPPASPNITIDTHETSLEMATASIYKQLQIFSRVHS